MRGPSPRNRAADVGENQEQAKCIQPDKMSGILDRRMEKKLRPGCGPMRLQPTHSRGWSALACSIGRVWYAVGRGATRSAPARQPAKDGEMTDNVATCFIGSFGFAMVASGTWFFSTRPRLFVRCF